MKILRVIILMLVLGNFTTSVIGMSKDNFESVEFVTEDGGLIKASLFKASSEKVVIFAHGAIFDKESWYFLAEKFQNERVSALSIDFRGYGKSKKGSTDKKLYDIIGAITYLHKAGYNDINLIGGSMGGAAVLSALSMIRTPVNRVVLLAPAGGPPIKSTKTDKLFIVSKEEGLYDRVKSIYEESADTKSIMEFDGSAHAQHMFKEAYADKLELLILKFIGKAD